MVLSYFRGRVRKIAFHTCPWKVLAGPQRSNDSQEADQASARLDAFLRRLLRLENDETIKLVGSGRSAIRLGLAALAALEPRKKAVIVPSYCCSAVLTAITDNGLIPLFIDTSDILVSRADQYLSAISADTLGAIVVNLCGRRLPFDEHDTLLANLRKLGVFSLEDNCQALCEPPQGARPDMECYSFGFSKSLRATSGGALIARVARDEIERDFAGYECQPKWAPECRYEYYRAKFGGGTVSDQLATNMIQARTEFGRVVMSDLDLCLAANQLDELPHAIDCQVENSLTIIEAMGAFSETYRNQGVENNMFTRLPVILPTPETSGRFWSFMNERGIELEGMYTPLHMLEEGRSSGFHLPKSEHVWQRVFNLPNRADMDSRDIKHITRSLTDFAKMTA
ncbi:DegT/DnrJ/EryC1/StrS family aminotransferase [Bradyrhizobium sediminis]|uniref:DegT/DnrJ/EryC1/StrS family aminotransferase n=1 Tax=Bradyrhizobium sediminis TaxID=2840469 RepID=A0A975P1W9_9BRAD|nr:DegT/DnrJ/EryC1/StrS family aminotransferase [Bradyrhizobium sediminis]QWG25100.1 DegT/DnrJ/EryC1/StrS family aminotransferase [Bradyrhizobium sediminis]